MTQLQTVYSPFLSQRSQIQPIFNLILVFVVYQVIISIKLTQNKFSLLETTVWYNVNKIMFNFERDVEIPHSKWSKPIFSRHWKWQTRINRNKIRGLKWVFLDLNHLTLILISKDISIASWDIVQFDRVRLVTFTRILVFSMCIEIYLLPKSYLTECYEFCYSFAPYFGPPSGHWPTSSPFPAVIPEAYNYQQMVARNAFEMKNSNTGRFTKNLK